MDEQVVSVQQKLQVFYDGLSDEEKPVLEALLASAAEGPEVEGHGIIVEERPTPFSINVRGGAQMNLGLSPGAIRGFNPQPEPPGRPAGSVDKMR